METSTVESEDTEDSVCPVAMVTDSEAIRVSSPTATTNQETASATSGAEDSHAPSVITMVTSDQLEVCLRFLCAAHEYLGSSGQGWCVRDGGCLLKTMVARLREELRVLSAHPPKTREVQMYLLTHSLTPSPPHSLTPSPPHSLTPSLPPADSAEGTGAVLLLSLWPPSQEGQG